MSRDRLLRSALAAALVLFAAACGSGETKAPPRPPVLVRVTTVEKGSVPFVIRAPGLVVASESVEVTSRLDSQVMQVHFREGDRVAAGQLLFTLDDRALVADLTRQQATLATGEAELENAKRQFERARNLAAGGFESTAVLDKARADFEAGTARVAAIRAEIDRLQVMLGYTRVTAAIEGRAGVIRATTGNAVKANDAANPLVVINRLSPILVQFGLPQQVLTPLRGRMASGDVATRVIRDGLELPEAGRIEFIDNAINRSTGTFEGRATFANADEALWPGMIVEILIRLGEDTGVVAVPEIAVQHGPSGDFVFVVADGKAAKRTVKVRRYGDGTAVVEGGLEGGEAVAVDGMLSLSEGTPVQLAGAKAQAGEAASPGAVAPAAKPGGAASK